jgi:1-acyl-sn-glycerol-3-phosphate acyltransferase
MWFGAVAAILVILVFWMLHAGSKAQGAEWGNSLVNSLDGVSRLICKRFHNLNYEPIQWPPNGGAIVASNHLSGLDPLLLACASNKPLRYMIATEQYNRPLLRRLYKIMGCIPVDRTGAPEKAFYAAKKALDAGELIVVFPQGRITLPNEDIPLKRGAILLADLAGAPIIPVRLSGIKGVGHVIPAIFMRSDARLETGPLIRVDGPRDDRAKEELKSFICGEPGGGKPVADGTGPQP